MEDKRWTFDFDENIKVEWNKVYFIFDRLSNWNVKSIQEKSILNLNVFPLFEDEMEDYLEILIKNLSNEEFLHLLKNSNWDGHFWFLGNLKYLLNSLFLPLNFKLETIAKYRMISVILMELSYNEEFWNEIIDQKNEPNKLIRKVISFNASANNNYFDLYRILKNEHFGTIKKNFEWIVDFSLMKNKIDKKLETNIKITKNEIESTRQIRNHFAHDNSIFEIIRAKEKNKDLFLIYEKLIYHLDYKNNPDIDRFIKSLVWCLNQNQITLNLEKKIFYEILKIFKLERMIPAIENLFTRGEFDE